METRFKKTAKIFDIGIAAVAAILSVGMMLYGVFFYDLKDTWPELVLNLFYIACLVMMRSSLIRVTVRSPRTASAALKKDSSNICWSSSFLCFTCFSNQPILLLLPYSFVTRSV